MLLLLNKFFVLGLRAIKLLASYQADRSNKEIVLLQLNEWLNDPVASGNTTLQLIAATIFVYEDSVKDAYQAIKNGVNIEQ